jgi:hypothetical protein
MNGKEGETRAESLQGSGGDRRLRVEKELDCTHKVCKDASIKEKMDMEESNVRRGGVVECIDGLDIEVVLKVERLNAF